MNEGGGLQGLPQRRHDRDESERESGHSYFGENRTSVLCSDKLRSYLSPILVLTNLADDLTRGLGERFNFATHREVGLLWGHLGMKRLERTAPPGRSGATPCRLSAFPTAVTLR